MHRGLLINPAPSENGPTAYISRQDAVLLAVRAAKTPTISEALVFRRYYPSFTDENEIDPQARHFGQESSMGLATLAFSPWGAAGQQYLVCGSKAAEPRPPKLADSC